MRIGNTPLPVEEYTKFLGLWWDSQFSFKKHISVLKTVQGGPQPHGSGCSLGVGRGQRHILMLYRAIVRSKLNYGCIVYDTASNSNLRQLDSIHNTGLRLALGAIYTSHVSCLYTEANEAPLEERDLKLSMDYYLKTRACINTRELYVPMQNGRGGMTGPPAYPIGLKVEAAMASADVKVESVCPPIWPDRKPRLSSMSIKKLKDHMMMSILMAPKWTREWGQRQSATAISWMER